VTKTRLQGELEQLLNGKHEKYGQMVVQFEQNKKSALQNADFWYAASMEDAAEQAKEECDRIEKETKQKLGQLERRLRNELESCRQELMDEKREGDSRVELMRDIDTSTRTLRTQAERRRKRLYGEGLDGQDEELPQGPPGPGKKRNAAAAKKEKIGGHPAFRASKDLDMLLPDWEIETDIKTLHNMSSTSSRGRRPPAKLANGLKGQGRF
jgi:hypothetical protein